MDIGAGAESERCTSDPFSAVDTGSDLRLGNGGGTVSLSFISIRGRSNSTLFRGGRSGGVALPDPVEVGGSNGACVSWGGVSEVFRIIPCPGLFPNPVTSPGLRTTRGTTIDRPADGCINTGGLVTVLAVVLVLGASVLCEDNVKVGSEIEGDASTTPDLNGEASNVGLDDPADEAVLVDNVDPDRSRPLFEEELAAAAALAAS